MDAVLTHGKTAENMKENISSTRNMDSVRIDGLMGESTRGSGSMENSMEEGDMYSKMDR